MSYPDAAVNIPTFVADLPPSPRSRRQQSYQDRGAKYAADANTAKLNEGLRAASINAPIPSMILQESAEEEQSLAAHRIRNDQRKNMPVITSHSADSAHSVHGVTVTAGSSDVKSTSATASSAMPSAMVQVMLQLPGTSFQLPVNIPAETILPALTKYLPKLPPAMNTVTTASPVTITNQEPPKIDTTLAVPQRPPVSQPSFTSASRGEVQRQSETVAPQIKIPRLSNANARTSSLEHSRVSPLNDNPLASSYMSSVSNNVSDSDGDDSSLLQHTHTNRNAATRCRQKKKVQVEKMEEKAKELQNQNKQLEIEMRELQQDITKLQSLLREHSECFLPSSTVHASHGSDSA